MKNTIYLLIIAVLCFHACDENEIPEMETETETPHELEGVWELVDFSGDMSETANGSNIEYFISLYDPLERAVRIEQDSFCIEGRYGIRIITITNGDTTKLGTINYGSNDPNEYSICRFSNYTVTENMIKSENKGPFGIHFPAPHTDFGINKDDTQTSNYSIEDNKLIITTSEEGNEATNLHASSLNYKS